MESHLVESGGDLVPGRELSRLGTPEQQAAKLSRVLELQKALVGAAPAHQPVQHHFAPGVYVRQWFSREGDVTVGKAHRKQTINILAAGKVMVVNVADDRDRVIITAPYVWVAPPGSKRAVVTLETCCWVTVHVTNETDLEKIEAEFICPEGER